MKYLFALVLITIGLFTSCKKVSNADFCSYTVSVKVPDNITVKKGDTIHLTADDLPGGNYIWYKAGNPNYLTYDQNYDIYNADFTDRGWYYMFVNILACSEKKVDSTYVNVLFPQGAPTCSLADNMLTSSNLTDHNFTNAYTSIIGGDYTFTGSSSNGNLKIFFNSYWKNHEPEDGKYETTAITGLDDRIDRVYIIDHNQSIDFYADPGKAVYVSHVNGKLRVAFCSAGFTGTTSSGNTFHSIENAMITTK